MKHEPIKPAYMDDNGASLQPDYRTAQTLREAVVFVGIKSVALGLATFWAVAIAVGAYWAGLI